ncbi:MAG: hypothetical protein J0L75_21435 [Spirochaetes bacterium]|nr:hypothetical protein [Spirochaetota bacterium]
MDSLAHWSQRFALGLEPYLQNPGFLEKVHLARTNLPAILLLILVLILLYRYRRARFAPLVAWAGLAVLALIPFVLRAFDGYAYDSPLAFLAWAGDLAILGWGLSRLGGLLRPVRGEPILEISLGVAGLCFLATLATWAGAQAFIPRPSPITHLLLALACLALIGRSLWRRRHAPAAAPRSPTERWEGVLAVVVIALPVLPYLFTPAPPDCDINSMSELLGFFFQGQSLSHVATGLQGETFAVRYPAGLPSLAWAVAHSLNLAGSEVLLLLWLLTFALLVLNLWRLAKELGGHGAVALLFTLTTTLTGAFGFSGGVVQDMLAFVLGIAMIRLLLRDQFLLATLCLGASGFLQPIVTVSFAFAYGFWWLRPLARRSWPPRLWAVAGLSFLAVAYLYFATMAGSTEPSQPALMLAALTPATFFRNVLFWLDFDTHHLWPFLAVLAVPFLPRFRGESPELRWAVGAILFWFLGGCALNGAFGDTVRFNYTATFQKGFTVVGPLILSLSLAAGFLLKKASPAKNAWVLSSFLLLWILFLFPGFDPKPVSVFTTHSDIRMAKTVLRKLPEGACIANLNPYSATWGKSRNYYSFVRGDSFHHTVFGRLNTHSVKKGRYADRSFDQTIHAGSTLADFKAGFAKMGATHLLIIARPESDGFCAGSVPLARIGSTYLYALP